MPLTAEQLAELPLATTDQVKDMVRACITDVERLEEWRRAPAQTAGALGFRLTDEQIRKFSEIADRAFDVSSQIINGSPGSAELPDQLAVTICAASRIMNWVQPPHG